MFDYYIETFKSQIIFLLLTIAICIIYFKKKLSSNDLDRIPGPKSKYPFIGNLDLFKIKGVPITHCKFDLS